MYKRQSAHNVGSVFRTSDAFLIEKIMLCGICPVPPKNEIRKTALGATESVDWEYFNDSTDCIKGLTEKGYKIISIEQADKATDLNNYSIEKSQKIALVFESISLAISSILLCSPNLTSTPNRGN